MRRARNTAFRSKDARSAAMLRLSSAFELYRDRPTATNRFAVGSTVRVALMHGVSYDELAAFARMTVTEIREREEWR